MRRFLWGPLGRLGLAIVIAVFAIDQAFKLWMLFVVDIRARGPITVTPFLDLVMAWNLGVSYGLFPLQSAEGQLLLALFKVVVSIGLWVWLSRTNDRITVVSLALVIGGALGNALDRVLHGGVADFFSLHLRAIGSTFHWYVFNLADVAIVAGVVLLLYESIVHRRPDSTAVGTGTRRE